MRTCLICSKNNIEANETGWRIKGGSKIGGEGQNQVRVLEPQHAELLKETGNDSRVLSRGAA